MKRVAGNDARTQLKSNLETNRTREANELKEAQAGGQSLKAEAEKLAGLEDAKLILEAANAGFLDVERPDRGFRKTDGVRLSVGGVEVILTKHGFRREKAWESGNEDDGYSAHSKFKKITDDQWADLWRQGVTPEGLRSAFEGKVIEAAHKSGGFEEG